MIQEIANMSIDSQKKKLMMMEGNVELSRPRLSELDIPKGFCFRNAKVLT